MVNETVTYYFEKGGEQNTTKVLEVAKARALELNVKHVVVASTRGETGVKALETFKGTGIEVVVVTHQTGHTGPGVQQLTEENRKRLPDPKDSHRATNFNLAFFARVEHHHLQGSDAILRTKS